MNRDLLAVKLRDALWTGRYRALEMGWRGLAPPVLLVGSLLVVLLVLVPQARERARLEEAARIAAVAAAAANPTVANTSAAQTIAELDRFVASFPPTDQVHDIIGRIHHAASDRRLVVPEGQYASEDTAGEARDRRLQRVEIVLPLRGPYSEIRGFMSDVLQREPALAIDGLSITRPDITAQALDAEVRMSLFVRPLP